MCGRYASSRNPEDLIEEFEIEVAPPMKLAPNWNTAPTQSIYVIAELLKKRTLLIARWGLIPSWATDLSMGARTVNARMESVAEKPSYRAAFKTRRCLIPADGYYEWYQGRVSGSLKAVPKQPFYLHRKDGRSLAMAGLYEYWRNPVTDEVLTSATIITTSSQGALSQIHDRMPVLLPEDRYRAWLDSEERAKAELLELLQVQEMDQDLVAEPVSRLVNSVRNNGSGLIRPVPLELETPLI